MRKDRVEEFFESCLEEWERKNGRKPRTRDEMWEAVMDGMERPKKPN